MGAKKKDGGKRGTVSFSAPQDLLDVLEEAKWTMRKSKGSIIVEALEEYFKKHKLKIRRK